MKRHRASLIFKGEIASNIVLEVKRNDQSFWDYIKLNHIPDAVKWFIRAAGFGGVLDCGFFKVDHALITTLVERWRPETHTFHLPIGEVTVTLEDIQVLWGLPVEGKAVTGIHPKPLRKEDCERLCELHMGFTPIDDAFVNGMIKLTELRRVIMSLLPEGAGQVEIMQIARVYLMQMLGGTVCPDSSGSRMSILYINNFIDLCPSTPLSWGSAVLACMYRNLCKATDPKTKSINGPNGLLQLWAWERIKSIAPRVNREDYNLQLAYGARFSRFSRCTLKNKGLIYNMELIVDEDKRRSSAVPDHICIKCDFSYLKHYNSIPLPYWLRFTVLVEEGAYCPVEFTVTRENDPVRQVHGQDPV